MATRERPNKDFFRARAKLYSSVRSRPKYTSEGWLAESTVFEVLEQTKLPYIRTPETAPVDLCLVDSTTSTPAPDASWSTLRTWRFAMDHKKTSPTVFVPGDIKFISIIPSGHANQPYVFYDMSPKTATAEAQFYIVVVAGVPDYVGVVPKGVWEAHSDIPYDDLPLIYGIPGWLQPFMVRLDPVSMEQALREVVKATSTAHTYTNPSNGLKCRGWTPEVRHEPLIWSTNTRMHGSTLAIMELWERLETHGIIATLNPIQPLICDFVLDLAVEGLPEVFVEFKRGNSLEEGRRSCWWPTRQWHFVIIDDTQARTYLCFARHEVRRSWLERTRVTAEMRLGREYDKKATGVSGMINHMRSSAEAAIAEVDRITADPPEDGFEIEDMLVSSADQDLTVALNEISSKIDELGRQNHSRQLPHLFAPFNAQCAKEGSIVLLPLDTLHPLGNALLIRHVWTDADKEAFINQHRLPLSAWDEAVMGMDAIVVRLEDWSAGVNRIRSWPLLLRQAYCTRTASRDIRYLIIGSPLRKKMTQGFDITLWALLPSHFTVLHDTKPREPLAHRDRHGAEYFRKNQKQESDALPEPAFRTSATSLHKLCRGSAFLKGDINPLRNILSIDALYQAVSRIMHAEGSVSIDNPSSRRHGASFDAASLRIPVHAVHQAAWDYGLTRKVARAADIQPGEASDWLDTESE